MTITADDVYRMMTQQSAVNSANSDEWPLNERPWHRAVYIHATRVLEMIGGWRDLPEGTFSAPDALYDELVTIWRFGLSMEMRRPQLKDISGLQHAGVIHDRLTTYFTEAARGFSASDAEAAAAIIDGLASLAAAGLFDIQSFAYLMALAGLTPDELVRRHLFLPRPVSEGSTAS